MASICKEVLLDVAPEQVWAAVRDVGAMHRRLVPGYTVDTHLDGDTRTLTMSNGVVVRELIVAVDGETRRLAYAEIEGRMPLVHHHASFQVFPEGDGRSLLVWITDFLPNEFADEIRMRVERGAAVMKQTIEAEANSR